MKKLFIFSIFVVGTLFAGAINASAQTSVAGEWDGSFNTPGGPRPIKFIFQVEGEKLTGTVKRANGDVALSGTIKGEDINFSYTIEYNGNAVTLTLTGKVKGDSMGGTIYFNENTSEEWGAKRAPKPPAQ